MKDLAAFVHAAELDFVCVNKLGYRLPASQPAIWIWGKLQRGGGLREQRDYISNASVWICLQEVKGCVKYTLGWATAQVRRPAASLKSSNPIFRVQNLLLNTNR